MENDRAHLDRLLLIELTERHDDSNGNEAAADGTVAGVDRDVLMEQAAQRAQLMLDYVENAQALTGLTEDQRVIIYQAMTGMWGDGFVVGATYREVRPAGPGA